MANKAVHHNSYSSQLTKNEKFSCVSYMKVAAIQIKHVLVQPSKLKQSLNFDVNKKYTRKSVRIVDFVKLNEFLVNYVLTAVKSYQLG